MTAPHAQCQPECASDEALAIAAVIDPVAFDPISLSDKHPGWQYRRETAIDTANKILALRPPAQLGVQTAQEPAAWLETYWEDGGGKDTKVWVVEPKADPSTISIEPLYPRGVAQTASSSLSSANRGGDNGA